MGLCTEFINPSNTHINLHEISSWLSCKSFLPPQQLRPNQVYYFEVASVYVILSQWLHIFNTMMMIMVPLLLGIPVPCAGVQESVPFHTSFPVAVVRWGLMEPLCFDARADTEMTWLMLLFLIPCRFRTGSLLFAPRAWHAPLWEPRSPRVRRTADNTYISIYPLLITQALSNLRR